MLLFFTCAAVAFAVDQLTKRMASSFAPVRCGSWLYIRHLRNQAAIFRKGAFRASMLLLWCISMGSVLALLGSGVWFRDAASLVGVGCAVGGAAGNLSDIVRRQHVVDFIDLGWWPVFNFADVAIVGGLLLAAASGVSHL